MKVKVLIWIGVLILHSIVEGIVDSIGNAFLAAGLVSGDSAALVYGAIMGIVKACLIGFALWLIFRLCKKWDLREAKKAVAASNLSVEEYAIKGLSYDELVAWAKLPDDALKGELKKVYKANRITKEQRILLLNLEIWRLRDLKKNQMAKTEVVETQFENVDG